MDCTKCIHKMVCGIDHEAITSCRHYIDETNRAPAYVGQTIYRIRGKWGYKYGDSSTERNYQVISWHAEEGKVSMIQQKVDKSWKIRISQNGSVSDHTISEIGEYIFFDKEEADNKAEEKTNGLSGL